MTKLRQNVSNRIENNDVHSAFKKTVKSHF